MTSAIHDTAIKILEQAPSPAVRFRLLRDVLDIDPQSPRLQQAKAALEGSHWVRELAIEQRQDGGWGPFHSRNTSLRQRIPTTEVGVSRALALGLDASHPILQKASAYILDIMKDNIPFPDRHEVNDRWQTSMRLFLASTLSLIQPDNPALEEDRMLWLEIARRTFQSGTYNEQDEISAHAELTGASVQGSYLVLSGEYQLNILGSRPGTLTEQLEAALLQWLWHRPDGIGYLGVPLNRPPHARPGPVDRWLSSHEMLERLFPAWLLYAQPSMDWLWRQRDDQGYWDFGPKPASSSSLPLSDDWRKRQDRLLDWTSRVLILLSRYGKVTDSQSG